MQTTIVHNGMEFRFSDEDICNPDDFIPGGEYNPHNVRGWLLHDHGFTVCVVFADSLQDAIDEAVDADKMDRYLVTADQADDYGGDIYNSDSLAYLGNASEPFDIETLGYVEFAPPAMSICRLMGERVYEALSCHVV